MTTTATPTEQAAPATPTEQAAPAAPTARPSRRNVVLAGAGALGLAVGGSVWWGARHVAEPLHSSALALTADGVLVPIRRGAGHRLVEGSRILDDPTRPGDTRRAVEAERAWLASGRVPGAGGAFADLGRFALLDLRGLLRPRGALIAGWAGAWRYVWPRDAAFGAAAFAATGHDEEALAVLAFLQGVQERDGTFQARYRYDGSGPPDRRGTQLDGTGWALWATSEVANRLPPNDVRPALDPLRGMVVRSVAAIERLVARTGLPPVSRDYWEVREDRLTLGTVAPLVAGLAGAASVARLTSDDGLASRADALAERLDQAMTRAFGPGYPRHLGGRAPDAAITFTLPPIGTGSDPRRYDALNHAVRAMRRPAGGLAPGAGWKNDGISWTPETALVALAEAHGPDPSAAVRRLEWLDAHRTAHGALPEKVLYDGSPAGPAPLSWTAALVLLTLDKLDRLAA